MSSHVINLINAKHQQVQELLPWYVMDTLDADEREVIDRHLVECDLCRRELDWQRQMRAAHDEPMPDYDVENALARLHARVPAIRTGTKSAADPGPRSKTWLYWALAAQLLVICGLASWILLNRTQAPDYHALSSPGAAQADARLVVMFAPQTTEAQLRESLRLSRARIVDGPTVNGAYVLAVPSANAQRALTRLKRQSFVTLVQMLDPGVTH